MRKTFFLSILMLLTAFSLFARGADEKIGKGNSAFAAGDFEQALKYYEEAQVNDPESPYIYFNKGTAYFRIGDYGKAKEAFLEAAKKTKDLALEAKAYYNLGNTNFSEAGKHIESDLRKAIELYQEAIGNYQTALDRDKTQNNALHKDAARNIEVTRLIVRDLLDKLKKQQEQNKGEDDKLKKIMEKIAELIEREQRAVDYTQTLKDELDAKGISAAVKNNAGKVKTDQQRIRKETEGVLKELNDLAQQSQGQTAQGQNPQIDKIKTAGEHVRLSVNFQQLAENQLGKTILGEAVSSESSARDELIKALEALSGEQNQDNKQDQQEEEQKEEQEKQAAAADDIIDEEKQNKKEREADVRAGYSEVTRDW